MTEQRIVARRQSANNDETAKVSLSYQFEFLSNSKLKLKTQTLRKLAAAQPGLVVALAVYLGLAFSYFFIVPIFEAPDEWTHTGHVQYIAEGNGLPVMLPGQGIWGGQQPPLYYVIGALLIQPFDLDRLDDYLERTRNPHASVGYALDPGNKNNYLHSSEEDFPYRGLSLGVHVLRLLSIAFGLTTVIFTYFTAFELMAGSSHFFTSGAVFRSSGIGDSSAPLFAAAVALFVACQPMFAFITASVANEPANMAFSAVTLWLAQRYVLYGPSRGWRRAVAVGIGLGLVSISKMTGLSVGLVVVVAVLIAAITTRKIPGAARLLWRDGLIIGLFFSLVGGWWYWRNYRLYGDFFQRGLYKLYFNQDPQPLTLSDFLYTLSTGEVSFWATFGWLNIVGPDWIYSFYRIISRVGLVGVALAALITLAQILYPRPGEKSGFLFRLALPEEMRFRPALLLHLIFPVALAFSLTRLVATEGGLQGRQLLPALGSIALVVIWGWWALSPARLRRPILAGLLATLLGLAVWLPYGVVARAYTPPNLLAEAGLPADLHRLDLTFNGEIKLLAAEMGREMVRPGERVPVTVYWQALKPMETNYSVFVHLIGRDYQNVGQFNTYPGLGLRPTRTLQPGQIIKDTYPVQVNGGSDAPTRLLVNVGLFDIKAPGRPGIPAVGPDGRERPPVVDQLKLIPHTWPAYDETNPPLAEFDDHIWLVDYTLSGCDSSEAACVVTFEWLAQGAPAADYTVFIQLWRDGEQVTGFDAPPLENDYPTGLWERHELIIDPHPLDLTGLAAGEYRILAGLYNLSEGKRLPATVQGQPLPDYAVDLGPIQIR